MTSPTESPRFTPAPDGINPHDVPVRKLASGATLPVVGLGTFGSDAVTAQQIADAVYDAARLGYRHFDCASVYGNEKEIGATFRKMIDGGLSRDSFWVTSKLWNDKHGDADVIASCQQSLADLQLHYLDLYLVHWPFPNFHPAGCDVNFHDPNAKPYIHESFMKTWRQMEKLVEMGSVKHIGVSNMTIPKLKLVLRDAVIKPAVNEMELHPHFQQPELFQFVVDNGLLPIGYSPIGSPGRPERDRTPDDTVDTQDPVIVEIAQRHGIHPAAVCLKWAIQRGQVPIPFSTTRRNYLANLTCAVSAPLSADEMAQIAKTDRGCRLIKGQVFCWKDNQDWQDLWDLNGEITPA